MVYCYRDNMVKINRKKIFLFLCCILTIQLTVGEYKLVDSHGKEATYRSDYQTSPIIGPLPREMSYGNTTLKLHECGISFHPNHAMMKDIIKIYNDVTFGKGYLERCSGNSNEASKHTSEGRSLINVKVNFNKNNDQYLSKGFKSEYERYTLTADVDGNIIIAADYYPGIVRGLDTLSQLIVKDKELDKSFTIDYLPIKITDYPEFGYRGIMVDTAREFFFPDVLKMILDGMMLGRNNVLHWHFAEDDSIPMYSESYPDLVNYTAFRMHEIYTPENVKEIVHYANIRGIKIVPEMEGPSHLHILGFYPEFQGMVGCFRNYTDTTSNHGGPPYSPVNPANEKTYEFLSKYLRDLSKVFESDYWHLGGDEVTIGCVSNLNGTNEFLKEKNITLNNLQDYYIKRERSILESIGSEKTAGYWYRGEGQTFGDSDILQYWGGSGGLQSHFNRFPNNYFVISPMDVYYLDCGYPNQYAGGSWCGGIHNWRDIWRLDPLSQVDSGSKHRLLGGELCAWSEMNNEYNLPTKLFPRGAALSFRHWNPNGNYTEVKVFEMMIKHQYRLKAYEIPHQRVTMRYCEEHTHHCFGK